MSSTIVLNNHDIYNYLRVYLITMLYLSIGTEYTPANNYVLCIYRYGLPVNFQAILVHPNKKGIKRLRDALNQLYSHLDSSATGGAGDVSASFPHNWVKFLQT